MSQVSIDRALEVRQVDLQKQSVLIPLAVLALCSSELLWFEEMTARIFMYGPLQGYMVPRVLDGPFVQVAVGVDAEEARAMVMHRLLAPSFLQMTQLLDNSR